jgi:hypothetical protein
MVVQNGGGHRQDALDDSDGDALEGPAAVLFQAELAFKGVNSIPRRLRLVSNHLALTPLSAMSTRPGRVALPVVGREHLHAISAPGARHGA